MSGFLRSPVCVLTRNFAKRSEYLHARLASASTDVKESIDAKNEEISIPYRIHRGPTDILKALKSTVKKDYLAPHYKYEDDPYLIPVSNVAKRSYALSREAGRKAARYFLENYPELFKCHKSDPLIKAFEPPVVYTEKDDVTEDTLKSCIDSVEIQNSLTVYKLLKERGLPVSQETKQELLEMLCFYNCEQPIREDYTEERWYSYRQKPKNTWKSNGEAEKLFQEMEKDAQAYCAVIQGAAKYLNSQRSVELYEEMCSKDLKASLQCYNSLLEIVPYIKQDGDMRWEYAVDLLKKMRSDNLFPNLATMNALLNIAAKSRRWNKAKAITMQILGEMRSLNIEPSLGSYYHVLTVFCINSPGNADVMSQVMKRIEGKEFDIRHLDDINFFSTAMEICNRSLGNKEMAYRLNDLFELGDNSKLMGNAMLESIYYRHFFLLLTGTEDFHKLMEVYEKYVPNTYTPEPSVMLEIIQALGFCGEYKYLPQICSDVRMFEHTEREEVLGELLKVTAGAEMDENYWKMTVDVIWRIVEKLDARAENRMLRNFSWTGQMLGDTLKIFLNGNDLEKTWYIVQKLSGDEGSISGCPSPESLVQVCSAFLQANEMDKVKFCMKYAYKSCHADIKDDLLKSVEELVKKGVIKAGQRDEVTELLKNVSCEAERLDESEQQRNLYTMDSL